MFALVIPKHVMRKVNTHLTINTLRGIIKSHFVNAVYSCVYECLDAGQCDMNGRAACCIISVIAWSAAKFSL